MKNIKDLTREELIELLKEEDRAMREEEILSEKKKLEGEMLKIEILRKEKEAEEKAMVALKLEEERRINDLQRHATEAAIFKKQLEQTDLQMEEIDKQLAELTDDTKNRINKLATQFIDLNKERNSSLTQLEYKSRNESADDFKLLDKSFRTSYLRNEEIIKRETEKEAVANRNIDILSKAIDLSVEGQEQDEYYDDVIEETY